MTENESEIEIPKIIKIKENYTARIIIIKKRLTL